jgi:SAM-dependent methyltransferase
MILRGKIDRTMSWLQQVIRRRGFDNRSFWNQRYAQDPAMGSGPGSRAENLELKNALIARVLEEQGVTSVLDVGCGDIEILRGLSIASYTGIDISDVVVARNRTLRPEWTFLCADLAGDFVPPEAELVMCLDVLIHQKRRQDYDAILGKALRAARKVALVSGYGKPDPGWNVFFHEPLLDSVRRIRPDASIEPLAEYRGTELLMLRLPG